MSQLSCYNWFCCHATAPRRLNSPGISEEQLPVSALQPLLKMHHGQGNTRRNKTKWEFAVTVSALHCKMPERKETTNPHKNPQTFHMVFISIAFFPLFSQRHSECWLIRHWRTQCDFAISHAICETGKKRPLHFAEKTCSDKTEPYSSYVLCLSFARHYLTSFPDESTFLKMYFIEPMHTPCKLLNLKVLFHYYVCYRIFKLLLVEYFQGILIYKDAVSLYFLY